MRHSLQRQVRERAPIEPGRITDPAGYPDVRFRRARSPVRRWLRLLVLLFCVVPVASHGHIGSPNVFFEGNAGPYPVRVVIRPPGVIPGLAQISVRVATNGFHRVTALPMRWNTGREGAPPPDTALPVLGDTNLFSTEIWFMQGGAQSIEVAVSGTAGGGTVIVPVNAVATRVLSMPRVLGWLLAGLGMLLFALLVTLCGAAVREGVLPAAERPGRRRVWSARFAVGGATVLLGLMVWLGKRWWDKEAGDYYNNRLYRPLDVAARLDADGERRSLSLELVDERFQRGAPLVPDHGKLMHLFLVREPGLDVYAHLHPAKRDWKTFNAALPDLPSGNYRLYADITYETGQSDTLTTDVTVPESGVSPGPRRRDAALDADDAWHVGTPLMAGAPVNRRSALSPRFTVEWMEDGALVANEETTLRFQVWDAGGKPVRPQPYMGMQGHLILRHVDGSVFTHLHPGGSFSMAAQQLFELRADGRAPLKVAKADEDPFCRLPTAEELAATWQQINAGRTVQPISFPYAVPKAGRYRMWIQLKVGNEVLTGSFDAEVSAK